jgi:predicted nucleic acid-binding protein
MPAQRARKGQVLAAEHGSTQRPVRVTKSTRGRWASQVQEVGISAITSEEICCGLSWRPNPRILQWFETFFRRHCQIRPVTIEIAQHGGQLRGQLRASGRARTQADLLIGATALVLGMTLVTRNTRDFEGCGIALLNPFS